MFKLLKNKNLYLIAEIGINHNGNYNFALKLIDKAKEAGFDAVKFQTFVPEEMTHKSTKLAEYQKKTNFKNMQDLLKNYKFTFDQFEKLNKYCKKKKIEFLSTPFDIKSANFLNHLNVKAFKISSGDLDNFYLLSQIKKFKKPVIISTGMSFNIEIYDTVKFLNLPKSQLAILHCISDYPTKLSDTYFSNLEYIKKFGYEIGFSDHTIGEISSSIAVSLGAKIIEKHITLGNQLEGPDHAASMPVNKLNMFIKTLHDVNYSISSKRKLTKDEDITRKVARKGLYYAENIKKGSIITFKNLVPLRPANKNISPKFYKKFLGKKIKSIKKKNTPLKMKDFY